MNRVFISIVVVFVVVAGLAIFQATRETAAAVVLPSELRAQAEEHANAPIRVAGRVAASAIDSTLEPEITLRFSIIDPGPKREVNEKEVPLRVFYRGLKPDMLQPGRDVIIDGAYRDGILVADRLMTQCPSKYEPPAPGGEKR